jgi:uncharacterized protein (TIGR02147 family)
MEAQPMSLPHISAYLDYRVFLRDWFDAKKRLDPSYSHTRFATDGGCSRSTLANVLSGNRSPRPPTLDAFARAMGLSPTERNHLGLLVELDTAPDLRTRTAVMERLLASTHYGQVDDVERHGADLERFLGSWWVPVVWELAGRDDFQADPDWLVAAIRPEITHEQARSALDTLFELDFLAQTEDGIERHAIRFRSAADDVNERAVLDYYRSVLPELYARIAEIPESERHVATSLATIDARAFPELKARIAGLVDQIAIQADAALTETPDELVTYQVVVQVLPVSRPG